MADTENILTRLEAGMPVLIGGDRVVHVSPELAAKFKPGDKLVAVRKTGELLHIPQNIHALVEEAVGRAVKAFETQASASDEQFTAFYAGFASRLADVGIWAKIAKANEGDVESAKSRGRSTTRLVADDKMRSNMIAGLNEWANLPSQRNVVAETIQHQGWRVDKVLSPFGVVGFVFEGRPNVLADATGVLGSGNTAVFRIGSDALATAKAIMEHAVRPSLAEAGLPVDSLVLLESAEHAAGWALFADTRLALAVARGSGRAVDVLGAIAREAGNMTSLHGTGRAWIIADETADARRFELAVYNSCDRKVCNTLNVVCVPRSRAAELVPLMLDALRKRGEKLGYGFRLHVVEGSKGFVPAELFEQQTQVYRAEGLVTEPLASTIPLHDIGREWEWERTPEATLVVVEDLDEAIGLFNTLSPLLAASLISQDEEAHQKFLASVNAPFIGDGFTRWVDGQYALCRPELGISSWLSGRLLARTALLTGDGVFTVKLQVRQSDPDVHR